MATSLCQMEDEKMEIEVLMEDMEHTVKDSIQEGNWTEGNSEADTQVKSWTQPNGGYGWVIVFASFLLWTEYGHAAQGGVFQLRVGPDFNATNTEFGTLNSIQSSIGPALGMFMGPMVEYLGYRPVVLIGMILLSSGYIISSFVEKFGILYLTYGIMPSIAIGLYICTGVVAVNEYFSKHSAKANALMISGYNIAVFLWPPFGNWLCLQFGWRNTFLIQGILHIFIGILCIVLLKPPGYKQYFFKCNSDKTGCKRTGLKDYISGIIDLEPLKDITFDIHLLGAVFYVGAHNSFVVYIPIRSEMLGIAPSTAALHVSVLGIVVCVMTFFFGIIGDIPGVHKGIMYTTANFLSAIFALVSSLLSRSLEFFLFVGFLGVIQGAYLAVEFAFFVSVCGKDRLPSGTGWYTTANGIGPLILLSISGVLLDKTDDPNSPFYLIGAAQLLCASLFLWVNIRRRKDKSSEINNNSIDGNVDVNSNELDEITERNIFLPALQVEANDTESTSTRASNTITKF